jgi:glycosyltransferase involved in cell wall biosynthesis
MKIGLLIYGSLDTVSGGYFYDCRLVSSLRERGEKVQVFCLPWRNYAAHLTDNLCFRLPPDLDLLIQDELNHPSLLAANARQHPYPVISLVHHLRSSENRPAWQNTVYRSIERDYLNSVDGFIFNSRTTRDAVHALNSSGKPNLIAYPPTDRFRTGLSETLLAKRSVQSSQLRLIFLGNLIPRKGLHTLLMAISCLPANSVILDVIGSRKVDQNYDGKIQDQVRTLGLGKCVEFHGMLDDHALQKKLESADVLAVPSSYEGFGIVYLEGMAFGLPAIGTMNGAASETISDGENGYLIASNDFTMLASRLKMLASDRSLLLRMSINALYHYHKQPKWEQTAENIAEFLSQMVS